MKATFIDVGVCFFDNMMMQLMGDLAFSCSIGIEREIEYCIRGLFFVCLFLCTYRSSFIFPVLVGFRLDYGP